MMSRASSWRFSARAWSSKAARPSGSYAIRTTPTTWPASPSGPKRHRYEDYLAWRTEHGFTATFEAMLTEPLVIHYYDEAFYSPGIAATTSGPAG
jgi:hypothetical protein